MSARVEHDGNVFYAANAFNERHLFKGAGWRWNPDLKRWWTESAEKAVGLSRLFTDSAKRALPDAAEAAKAVEEKKMIAVAASKATDAEIEIPAPEGLGYLPYQKAGIAVAIANKNTLLADEMGLGKTVQALGLINAVHSIRKTLVVCPASLKINWQREAEKWLTREQRVEIVKDGKTFSAPEADVTIINYELLSKHSETIRARKWDLLVCDESHALKNPKAARTKEIVGDYKKGKPPLDAGRKLFLTGTPILNRPAELWTTLEYFGVEKSWKGFHERYCDATHDGYGWDVSGASNLEELEGKLRANCMVRRLKKDVLASLPPKRRNVVPLEQTGAVKKLVARQIEARERAEANRRRAEELRASGSGEESLEFREAGRLMETACADFAEVSRIRRELGVQKIPVVVDMAAEELESSGPLLIFAHHREVVEGIAEGLREKDTKVVTLTGGDSPEARQAAVDAFQSGSADAFVGSIEAAGVGLTLTRSSRVIFAESSWTPAKLQQAEDRAHRIGQSDSVLVSHLVYDGSLDAAMLAAVIEKMDVADRALDGGRNEV